jgi:hypothetical protein
VIQVRATLNIPDRLIDDLIKETKAKTKTQAITWAIEDYLQKKRLEKLIALQGKLDLEDNWREMEALDHHFDQISKIRRYPLPGK